MQVAIVGLPKTGKTTLFELLTDGGTRDGEGAPSHASGKQEAQIRMARVPDDRIDYLSDMFKPRKTTFAQIQFTDVPGLSPGEGKDVAESTRFLAYLRTVDALVYVVRTFDEAPGALPADYELDPVGEIEMLNLDLVLADLQVVKNRSERLEKSRKRTPEEEAELGILGDAQKLLEEGKRLDRMGLALEQEAQLRGYALLTLKPIVIVANLSEDQFSALDYPGRTKLQEYANDCGLPLIELSAKIESEIRELPEGDREAFLREYGIEKPAIVQLSRKVYHILGLISFFTVGEDEVKAWPVHDGITAKKAAGKIHSDIERGFIRAEVIAFEDLKSCGSVAAARARGLYRLEGKEYPIKDGDIIHFRFGK